MAKNLCNKVRKEDDPYEIWVIGGWTWKVLKKYQIDDNKPYARAFCLVTSPHCPEGELGDVYISAYSRGTKTFQDQSVIEQNSDEKTNNI